MIGEVSDASLCARVLERLVDEGADKVSGPGPGNVGGDRILAEHLGSCVTCFRTLTELRDAPRLAEALRGAASAAPSALPSPLPSPLNDRFWEDLAVRTTAAAATALYGSGLRGPGSPAPLAIDAPRRGRWSVPTRVRVAFFATAVAAAAAFAVVARRPPAATPMSASAARLPDLVASAERAAVGKRTDDETGEETADVANLDGTALRRLLDRLSTRAPAVLTSVGGSDSTEASDLLGDDDRRVNDEVADLDGTALRRVASSLGGSSL
jgi:hypothetical protein